MSEILNWKGPEKRKIPLRWLAYNLTFDSFFGCYQGAERAMGEEDRFGEMVDNCLKARAALKKSGTPEMMALMDALLFLIGREAAKRAAQDQGDTPNVNPNIQ